MFGSPPQDMVLLGVEPKGAAVSAAAKGYGYRRMYRSSIWSTGGGDGAINAAEANWLERTTISMPLVVLKAYLKQLSQVCAADVLQIWIVDGAGCIMVLMMWSSCVAACMLPPPPRALSHLSCGFGVHPCDACIHALHALLVLCRCCTLCPTHALNTVYT